METDYGTEVLELKCDEERITLKSEPVEHKAEWFKNTELQKNKHCYWNLEVNSGDESKTSVINIAPILDHKSDNDTDDACQVTSHTDGRINSSKRIKLEKLKSHDGNPSIPNVTCAADEKLLILNPVSSTSFDRKPSNSPNSGDKLKTVYVEVIQGEPPSGCRGNLARKKADVLGSQNLCPVCLVPFTEPLRKSKEFADHLKLHYPELHTCKLCGQGFTRKDNLERHLVFHKNQKVHCCHLCGKQFKFRQDFEVNASAHMDTHGIQEGGKGKWRVPQFLSDYVKLNKQNAHAYTCNICGTAFSYFAPLLTHLAGHTNGVEHSCIVCAKECIWEADINMWLCKSHPDVCNICGVENLKPENFDDHRKTHYGTFYNCEKCDQGFTQQENLEKHVLTIHSQPENNNSCHLCHNVIESDVKMKGHIKCHNRTIFNDGLPDYFISQIKKQSTWSRRSWISACNLCGYSSDQVQPLISHLLEHFKSSSACPDCGKEYLSPDGLKDHVAKSHVHDDIDVAKRPKTNPQLHKTVKVQPLVKGAAQLRCRSRFKELHACPICEQEFFFSENLEIHKKAVHHGKSLHPCHACDVSLPSDELTGHIKQFHRDFVIGIQVDVSSRLMTTPLYLICSICGSKYSRSHWNSILSHLLLHLNTRYSCYLCGKEFIQENHLTQHHNLQHGQHTVLEVNHPLFVEHSYCILPKALPKAGLEGVDLQVESP